MKCRYASTNLRLYHLSLIQFMSSGCTHASNFQKLIRHPLNNQFASEQQMISYAPGQPGSRRRQMPRSVAGSPGCQGPPPRSPPAPPVPGPVHGSHMTHFSYGGCAHGIRETVKLSKCLVRTAAQTAPHCNAVASRCS